MQACRASPCLPSVQRLGVQWYNILQRSSCASLHHTLGVGSCATPERRGFCQASSSHRDGPAAALDRSGTGPLAGLISEFLAMICAPSIPPHPLAPLQGIAGPRPAPRPPHCPGSPSNSSEHRQHSPNMRSHMCGAPPGGPYGVSDFRNQVRRSVGS